MIICSFDKKNNTLLKKLKIETEMSRTYVDDNTVALKGLDPGVRFDPAGFKVVIKPELVESDKEVAEDKRTMVELQKIANTVYRCVQFLTDCPSSEGAGKMPVQDNQMYVDVHGLIKYEFFEKPCASWLAIPANSAHSKQQKFSVMVDEGLRRLTNNSQGLEREVRRRCMEEWARKLKMSGILLA